jgi:SAM-dependent methyltransferase
MATVHTRTVDEAKLQAFVEQAIVDMSAAISGLLLHIGDRLGLYKAMAGAGPITSSALAARTGTTERYVRECRQPGSQATSCTARWRRSRLPARQAMRSATDAGLPRQAFGYRTLLRRPRRRRTPFSSGAGELAEATRACSLASCGCSGPVRRPPRRRVASALTGGRRSFGRGRASRTSAADSARPPSSWPRFTRSTFAGIDIHEPSIIAARQAAMKAGVDHRAKFAIATAKQLPGTGYDLVCLFDCLHEMGDPVGAARRIRQALAPDGTLLLVEPAAGERLEDNLNPIGRTYYGLSTVVCTPASLAQEVGLGLGGQAGELQLRIVLREAGFTHVRRATETRFNLILEARP